MIRKTICFVVVCLLVVIASAQIGKRRAIGSGGGGGGISLIQSCINYEGEGTAFTAVTCTNPIGFGHTILVCLSWYGSASDSIDDTSLVPASPGTDIYTADASTLINTIESGTGSFLTGECAVSSTSTGGYSKITLNHTTNVTGWVDTANIAIYELSGGSVENVAQSAPVSGPSYSSPTVSIPGSGRFVMSFTRSSANPIAAMNLSYGSGWIGDWTESSRYESPCCDAMAFEHQFPTSDVIGSFLASPSANSGFIEVISIH